MKKIITLLPLLAIVFIAFPVNAKKAEKYIELEDNSQILGKWKIYAESPSRKKRDRKDVNIQWEFKNNGIIHAIATDTRGRTGETSINIKYSIENGAIKKQAIAGGSRYESCKVTKLEGDDMTLKCPFLYFYMKKK